MRGGRATRLVGGGGAARAAQWPRLMLGEEGGPRGRSPRPSLRSILLNLVLILGKRVTPPKNQTMREVKRKRLMGFPLQIHYSTQ